MFLKYIYLLLISAVPIIELRGAIPIGVSQNLNPIYIYIVCVIGATLPAPLLVFFFRDLLKWLKKNRYFKKIGDYLDNKVNKNSKKIMDKKILGIILFVGIPLPTTGTWTAAMVASVFKMRAKDVVIGILIGNIIAGIIVLSLSYQLI
ncbi:COG2426 family protein [Tepidibacter formicigenes]|jgi:uncharacterized membrane protein|uniref:Uncharacterized membrane protein n=1 Tax=Tepidibacter formicigenes DSM 15518 TaxID=1123349 RepID=A0A1M6P1J3_9FIRM|nr:small multi-drug export protein [Tepidibacter formicigenes]SHK01796.1 Uncharacterized membrane protein [Tepidibacter formicigenes DSM 15518]